MPETKKDIDLTQYEQDLEKQRKRAGDEAREKERLRVQGINDIYEKFRSYVPEFIRRKAVDEGMPLQDYQDIVLKRIGDGTPIDTPVTELGLSRQEIRRYSITRAILSQWKESNVDAAFERQLGARVLSGLRGSVVIPRRTAGATTYWVTEGSPPTEGANTFGQLSLSPKSVAANLDYTRNLLLQSNPSIDSLVNGDLAKGIALARISHQASAAAADTGMPTALRSVGLLDVVSTTSPGPSVARLVSTPVSTASRRTLVRNAG
jgi:hypothetical protein